MTANQINSVSCQQDNAFIYASLTRIARTLTLFVTSPSHLLDVFQSSVGTMVTAQVLQSVSKVYVAFEVTIAQ